VKGLVQRVRSASVAVHGDVVGTIGLGLCLFVGVGREDDRSDALLLADRVVNLRVFDDEQGRPDRSLLDVGGSLLVVSQFTLLADTRRGRRPSYIAAAAPACARPLVEAVVERARDGGVRVATGQFGARMDISLEADGPLTLMLDTKESRRR